jgi:hypothetical protein
MSQQRNGHAQGSVLERSRQDVALPPARPVRQNFPHHALPSAAAAVAEEMAKPEIRERVKPGMRVAIGVGSRGIGCIQQVVRTLVSELRAVGAHPFIFPAMGSHGGGTAEGQAEVLASYGISEVEVGVPVRCSMDTVELGTVLDGVRVFIDRIAFTEADAIIPVARVKPHTDFRGEIESGLHKMLGIGFGKHRGASYLHTFPLDRFGELMEAVGALVIRKAPISFGIAIVEDAYEDAAIIEAVPSGRMAARERELLRMAREWLPQLPFKDVDVLLVQEIGKNISGAGMDPNVTGRFSLQSMPRHIRIGRLVVLGLTEETHGNAAGVGMADIITRRAADRIDFFKTYTNHVTASLLDGAKLPLVAQTDREAVAIAVSTLWGVKPKTVQMAWIRNTLDLVHLWVTEPLWKEIAGKPHLESCGDPVSVSFDTAGNLQQFAPAPA